jgi:hypothetical protein
MAASSAARTIVEASLARRPEVILSVPAQAAAFVHGIAPGLVANALSIAARLLPQAGGIGNEAARGEASETTFTRSALTALGRKAEREYNQL